MLQFLCFRLGQKVAFVIKGKYLDGDGTPPPQKKKIKRWGKEGVNGKKRGGGALSYFSNFGHFLNLKRGGGQFECLDPRPDF